MDRLHSHSDWEEGEGYTKEQSKKVHNNMLPAEDEEKGTCITIIAKLYRNSTKKQNAVRLKSLT